MTYHVEFYLADGTYHVESFRDRWAAECYLDGLAGGEWQGKPVRSARLVVWVFDVEDAA